MVDYTERRGYNERYRERKEAGCPGWADEKSYKKKRATIEKVLKLHLFPQNAKFLELGCGNGNITLFMAGKGFEAYGVDIVPEAISWAEEKKKSSSLNADFRVGSIIDLASYEDDFFDFIFDGETLHCIIGSDDRAKCFASIYRVLKGGGIFHAKANCMREEIKERFNLSDDCYFDPETQCLMHGEVAMYYLSRESEFMKELKEAGFTVLESERITDFDDKHPLIQSCWLDVNVTKPK